MFDDHDDAGPMLPPDPVEPPVFTPPLQSSEMPTQPATSSPSPHPTIIQDLPTLDFLGKQFETLIAAVNNLNTTMIAQTSTMTDMKHTIESQKEITERQQKTMDIHTNKLTILARDAEKDDKPYDEKPLDDESTTRALYEMAVAKTRDQADRWNGRIDNTLIFVALFSAVVTGFAVMQTQFISPVANGAGSSGSNPTSTAAPLPASPDEWVCALYYLSLIASISVAVLCVLAREWVRKLTIMPSVPTWKERTLWHVTRVKRSEGWILAVMDTIYRSLLVSIGLFVAGLLYQLRNLAVSFEKHATVLLVAWALGVALASAVLLGIAATILHAVRYEGSVFEGFVSKVFTGRVDFGVTSAFAGLRRRVQELALKGWTAIGAREIVALLIRIRRSRVSRLADKPIAMEDLDGASEVKIGLLRKHGRTSTRVVRQCVEWVKSWRVKVEINFDELMNTYLALIADASDPSLLERTAASFHYRGWVQHGDGSTDQLRKAFSRLMAMDTSFRVRETVSEQISRFNLWITGRRKQMEKNKEDRADEDRRATEGYPYYRERSKERKEQANKEEEEERRAIQLTEFLVSQRTDKISRYFFPTWANCTDILHLLHLPFETFVSKCLCIDDYNTNLGNHHRIFFYSVNHCFHLLGADKSDDVKHILSHLNLSSAVRSFVLADVYWDWYDPVLELIVGDRKTEVLRFLTEFLSISRDWSNVDPGGASAAFLIAVGSPPQIPSDLDLFPIIAHIARYPASWKWRQASDALIAYLAQCDISTMSERTGTHEFLQRCVTRELRHRNGVVYDTSQESHLAAQTLLDQYQALFIPLPLPSPQSASMSLIEENIEPSDDFSSSLISDPDEADDVASSEPDTGNPSETHIATLDPRPFPPPIFPPASEDHGLIDMTIPPAAGPDSLPYPSSSRLAAYLSQPARIVYNWLHPSRKGQGSG
ncbi:hypothetical protein SISSUDRAFT_1122654 [Sistotremastrum suecicum HHB10207 ss-3]|uniref:DUF6535 domain-containing protein n=1 Tax=Sistotremastrum suecicum HHB10207 ss-3 TaxID=1314776 RepID=A0A165Z1P8_9AGAM|nr:hypothetical protein SISSUDRAFT_1122654 [Sistotremastrum suecicum HHB10207 ss-3]